MMYTRVTAALGIEHPIVQAPMAGGPTTAALVAAVSNAGGLGSLGAAYLAPEKLREEVREIRALTDRPFNVNLFVPLAFEVDPRRIKRANELLAPYREELGIEAQGIPSSFEESFDDQLEVVLEERVPVFSFTFGSPAPEIVGRLRENGTKVVGTATTVREGLRLQEDGVDAVVAQGSEAGGHRGTFLGDFGDALVGTMALVPQMADALSVPVVASGGIMDGRGLAAALVLGAEAAQMGTAFLACEESGAHPEFKRAVLEAAEDETEITRAFSGRAARGIKNRFLIEVGADEERLAPFPVQNALTRDVRAAAQRQDRPEFMSLWAGQAARLARHTTAADLVRETVEGAEAVLAGTAGRAPGGRMSAPTPHSGGGVDPLVHHFRTLAAYNRLANRRLYEACARLDGGDLKAQRPSFFGSIHGTLNHIMVGDRIWLARFAGEDVPSTNLDEILYEDFGELWEARREEDARIEAFAAGIEEGFLKKEIGYVNNEGRTCADPVGLLVAHLFNHQTHHRGQIHDMLSQTNVPPPVLDLHRVIRPSSPEGTP